MFWIDLLVNWTVVLTCVGNSYKMAKGAKRRARKCITIADKLKVISELKKGTAVKEVAKLFAISKTQVYDIYKHRDAIEKSLSSGSTATGSRYLCTRKPYVVK